MMISLSMLAAQKLFTRLTADGGLSTSIASAAAALGSPVPTIGPEQIVLTAASPDLSDRNMELGYPRICIYSNSVKNTQLEKFRSFSGHIGVIAEIWASAELVQQVDQWIHVYAAGVSEILAGSVGDWGDGMFYAGGYDFQIQSPKTGGFGFVESAKLTFSVNASLD